MIKPARKIYIWAAEKAHSSRAPLWLGVIFFLEIVFFLPLDALLLLFCLENHKRRFLYPIIAAIGSTLSGIFGYVIGLLLWDLVGPFFLEHLIAPSFFERLIGYYQTYQHLAVFLGAFLPIPFKIIVLSAGVSSLNFFSFALMVLLARLVRFFGIAAMMHFWGERVKAFIDRHFHRIVFAFGAKVALTITFFWALSH
jgi:membrane protein YqaA with SNARE-associated domain